MYSNNLIVSNNISVTSFDKYYTSTITKKVKRGYKVNNVIKYPDNQITININKTLYKSSIIENNSFGYTSLWIPGLPIKVEIEEYYSNLDNSLYNTSIKNVIITEDGAAIIQGFGYTLSLTFNSTINKIFINGCININKIIIKNIKAPELSNELLNSKINKIKTSGTYIQYDKEMVYDHISTDTVSGNIIKFNNKYINIIIEGYKVNIYTSTNGINFTLVYTFNSQYELFKCELLKQSNIISISLRIIKNTDSPDTDDYCIIYSTNGNDWIMLKTPRIYSGSGLVLINNQLIMYDGSTKIYKCINNNVIEVGNLLYNPYNYYCNGSTLIMATSKYYYKSTDGINFTELKCGTPLKSSYTYNTITNDTTNNNCWAITPDIGYTAISTDNGNTWVKSDTVVQAARTYFEFLDGVLIEVSSKGTLISVNYDVTTKKLSSTKFNIFIKSNNILTMYAISTTSDCKMKTFDITTQTFSSETTTITGKALSNSTTLDIINNEWGIMSDGTLFNITNGVASKIYIKPKSTIYRDFVKGYDKYVGIMGFTIYYSYDSFHWIKATTSQKYHSLAYSPQGVYVSGGASDNECAGFGYSYDGITWNHVPIEKVWGEVQLYFNGKIFAVDDYIYYSSDKGKTWVATNKSVSPPFQNTSPTRPIMKIINNELYCPGGSYAKLYKTTDGNNWSEVTLPANTGGVNNIYYINNKLFICCSYGIWYSTDNGTTWNATSLISTNKEKFYDISKIVYAESYYIAAGIDVTYTTSSYAYDFGVFYSTDGIIWEEVTKLKNSMFPNSLLFVQDFEACGNEVHLIIEGYTTPSPSTYSDTKTMHCIFTEDKLIYTPYNFTDSSIIKQIDKLKPLNMEVT